MSTKSSATRLEQESEELAQFREAWKAEVQQKNHSHPSIDHDPQSNSPSFADVLPGLTRQTVSGKPTSSSSVNCHANDGSTELAHSLRAAIEVYRKAVQLEEQGQIDDALRLFRQAFRMDPAVDCAYHTAEGTVLLYPGVSMAGRVRGHKKISSNSTAVDELSSKFTALSVKNKGGGVVIVTGNLANVLENFPNDLIFQQEDEKEAAPFKGLPDELLVLILRKLDPTSIERFAAVSRKARVISLDSAIWREIVEMIYRPPQVSAFETMDAVIDHYMSDFRRVYVEHPRVRTDGVYIALCHYIRQGLSENFWVNLSHHVTYYRYLRFFPDGQVLSLLVNEVFHPQYIIPLLKPTLRMKGLFIGIWHLENTAIHLQNLIDASDDGKHTNDRHPPATNITSNRYSYQMMLDLRSRPLGRWNRLDISCYESVDFESGEAVPISLKHERPFWFSKVRSYAS